MTPSVLSIPIAQAPDDLLLRAIALMASIWPKAGLDVTDAASAQSYVDRTRAGGGTMFVILEGERLIAHARVSERDMYLPEGALREGTWRVGCLAGVCVDQEFRGRDLGRRVVAAAFGPVDSGVLSVMLFQTAVPGFYEKLGALRLTNTFFNGTDARLGLERPWWEEHVMSYPASFVWPDAPVDLNGPAF